MKEQEVDYTDEIEKGRKVRGYMTRAGIAELGGTGCGGGSVVFIDQNRLEEKLIAVDIILPPKLLRITGYMCDEKTNYPICLEPKCGRTMFHCREVTLVEEGSCTC